jgi:adenine-specific DNA-methyltransferase
LARRQQKKQIPTTSRQPYLESAIQLAYSGKLPLGRVRPAIRPAEFALEERCGLPSLNGWSDRLIRGNNLAVLEALSRDRAVSHQITLAYLDPPFATNKQFRSGSQRTATVSASERDAVAYDDLLKSGEYLEYLRLRLILVRELLADNGSIYVHIGSQMAHYVRVLMDEVFGASSFLSDIVRVKCNPKNFRRRAYGNIKDTLLFYSKNGRHVWNELSEPMTESEMERLFPRVDSKGRRYTTTPLHAPGETKRGPTGSKWKGISPPPGRHWRSDPAELSRLDSEGLIEWSSSGNPRKKIYADEAGHSGKKRQDIWTFKDPQYPSYPTEKNLAMLETIVLTSSRPGDLVLDCFAGSGTTLVAAEKNQRCWIGIDSSPLAIRKARQRLLAINDCREFAIIATS